MQSDSALWEKCHIGTTTCIQGALFGCICWLSHPINQTKSKTTKIITLSQCKMSNHHELVIILIIIICGLDTINHNFLFSLQNLLVDLVFGCAQINLVRLSRMLRINPALFWHDPCSLLFITRMSYLRKTSVSSIRILLKLVLVC